jgi:hypothetical protein
MSVAIFLFGCARGAGSTTHVARDEMHVAENTTHVARDETRVAENTTPSGSATALDAAPEPAPAADSSHSPMNAGATGTLRLLAVSGFGAAVVAVPRASRAVPLLVATHGAGGDPRWECERWARVARERWFIACPRGVALRRGEEGSYYYPDHPTLEREVLAVAGAARATYGSLIAAADGVYLGYSQGATMGALMVVDHGVEFPHLVLIEGGSGDWTLKRAERFRQSGGRSVFIVCGTAPCSERASASTRTLERAGLDAVFRYAEGTGHTELGAVGSAAEALLETLAISGS